ncbi:hypothetical protein [Aegicerativicinus sediminis]|uniref:hypothetical protein n=1 Tax=Aegicerativicinus sediminis TaxID=2893202 RepID=UPI001E3D9905|nr:hypothetical protein [Aegicerativicinus sediminis]
MKRLLLLLVFISLVVSCSGRKHVERALHSGNYDHAINEALDKLKTNKNARRKQEYVAMLGDAFIKAEERDLAEISHLKRDGNPELYRTIYEIYASLDRRQDIIKPILPLEYNGQPLELRFSNFDGELIDYREKTAEYMYNQAVGMLKSNDKGVIREAFKLLQYVDRINPNYKNVRAHMDEAYARGTDHVYVKISNLTDQMIPEKLEQNLLNFDSYGLDDFWTAFHSNTDENLVYDYNMDLELRRINIAPEQISQRIVLREKEIKDGYRIKKDSSGKEIKVDKFVKVKAGLIEFNQNKATQILANVSFYDNKTQNLINSFPLESEFIFTNTYASYTGDKRALTSEDISHINNRQVPFPSNEQMVYDTGQNLKLKLKDIIRNYRVGIAMR